MKKIIVLFVLFIFNIYFIGCVDCKVYLSRDNKELKELKEEELKNIMDKYSSSIIDVLEIDDTKIVGFSDNLKQGVVVYEKDTNGNYIINQANELDMNKNNLGISNFRIVYKNYSDINNAKYGYVFISNGKKVSKIEITINDEYKYIRNIELGIPSMTLIKENISSQYDNVVRLQIRYFDKNNNELFQ